MVTPTLEATPSAVPTVKSAVNVFIKNESDGKVSAMVLGLPEYRVESGDRESALADLQKLIAARLAGAEVVSLEIEMSKPHNPWLHFAGMLKDDPYFDQMQEDIAEYRREKDAKFEDYYDQFETEESGEKSL
jgi:hypothetical protein